MNVNKVLEELKNYNISDYSLRDVFVSCVRGNIAKQLKVYVEDRKIEMLDTIADSTANMMNRLIKAYDTHENAKIFFEFSTVRFSLRGITDKNVEFHRYGTSSNTEIFDIIRYAVHGTFDEDRTEVNKIVDLYHIRYDNMIWEANVTTEVKIKSYKNGKIIVSGLTQEQKDRIQHGFDVVTKYRHVQV